MQARASPTGDQKQRSLYESFLLPVRACRAHATLLVRYIYYKRRHASTLRAFGAHVFMLCICLLASTRLYTDSLQQHQSSRFPFNEKRSLALTFALRSCHCIYAQARTSHGGEWQDAASLLTEILYQVLAFAYVLCQALRPNGSSE